MDDQECYVEVSSPTLYPPDNGVSRKRLHIDDLFDDMYDHFTENRGTSVVLAVKSVMLSNEAAEKWLNG